MASNKVGNIFLFLTLLVCFAIIITPVIYNAIEGKNASPHYTVTGQPFFKGAAITSSATVLMLLFKAFIYMIFSKKVVSFLKVVIGIIILVGAIIMIVDAYKQGMSDNTVYSVLDGLSYTGGGLGVITSLFYTITNSQKLFK
jgi:hypothetical protein